MDNLAFQNYLYNHIPLSKAMGAKVKEASENKVILKAPFLENINHKNTVFGGSLQTLAILSCWSLLHLNLSENYEVVITKSTGNFLTPVTGDFSAICDKPTDEEWDHFCKRLKQNGKAKLKLSAKIFQGSALAMSFEGFFAAIANRAL